MNIAIDGPAASGKSTVGFAIAQWLQYLYFDTGVMYRAVTLAVIQRGVNINDIAAVTKLTETVKIEVLPPAGQDDRQYTVMLDGIDVTWQLRSDEIDRQVSIPSKYPSVRTEMVCQQRRIAAQGAVVMVGRDIGTVVLPDADIKIYLDASVEERARRRHSEMTARGEVSAYDDVLVAMRQRDMTDSTRETSPLKPAVDAVIVDSTGREVADVIEQIKQIIAQRASRISLQNSKSATPVRTPQAQ